MSLLRERVTVVWLGLLALTILTTWVLSKDIVGPTVAVTGIFVVAAVKVRLVMLDFMELRTAPLPVRVVFEGWIAAVTVLILVFWFLTAGID